MNVCNMPSDLGEGGTTFEDEMFVYVDVMNYEVAVTRGQPLVC